MQNQNYLKCPGSDPLSNSVPVLFNCPECDSDIEIWSDETGGKCLYCNNYFKKTQLGENSTERIENLNRILQFAEKSGVTGVAVIPAKRIVIDEDLAERCREPRCENHGLSKSCPPHVEGPIWFKNNLKNYYKAVFFKIDVPNELLYSSERREIFRYLHETASGIEGFAINLGFPLAKAYTGGSCKKIFCHQHNECLLLSDKGPCRFPESARPSMSGFGVDVTKLFELAGWKLRTDKDGIDENRINMSNICGLVLIC